MEEYEPSSDFLCALAAGNVPLSGSEFAEANLQHLIAMTRDQDRANRDWAIFLLAQSDIDTWPVRDALLLAADDDDACVRAEAICGMAKRDHDMALPFIQKALSAETLAMPIFEAAAFLAHPSLIEDLRRWTAPSDDVYFDRLASDALAACETGKSKPL